MVEEEIFVAGQIILQMVFVKKRKALIGRDRCVFRRFALRREGLRLSILSSVNRSDESLKG